MHEKQNKASTNTEDVPAGVIDTSVKPLSEGLYGRLFYGIESHAIPTETEIAVAI